MEHGPLTPEQRTVASLPSHEERWEVAVVAFAGHDVVLVCDRRGGTIVGVERVSNEADHASLVRAVQNVMVAPSGGVPRRPSTIATDSVGLAAALAAALGPVDVRVEAVDALLAVPPAVERLRNEAASTDVVSQSLGLPAHGAELAAAAARIAAADPWRTVGEGPALLLDSPDPSLTHRLVAFTSIPAEGGPVEGVVLFPSLDAFLAETGPDPNGFAAASDLRSVLFVPRERWSSKAIAALESEGVPEVFGRWPRFRVGATLPGPLTTPRQARQLLLALEAVAGFFEELGVRPGTRVPEVSVPLLVDGVPVVAALFRELPDAALLSGDLHSFGAAAQPIEPLLESGYGAPMLLDEAYVEHLIAREHASTAEPVRLLIAEARGGLVPALVLTGPDDEVMMAAVIADLVSDIVAAPRLQDEPALLVGLAGIEPLAVICDCADAAQEALGAAVEALGHRSLLILARGPGGRPALEDVELVRLVTLRFG